MVGLTFTENNGVGRALASQKGVQREFETLELPVSISKLAERHVGRYHLTVHFVGRLNWKRDIQNCMLQDDPADGSVRMSQSRKRYTRSDWVEAAKRIFIDSGVEDVKVDVIAKRMKITRGSFYWHFKGREDLLDALLADWAERNMAGIETLRLKRDGAPTLADCIRFWVSMEDDVLTFDMAMRVWSRKSEKVAAATKQIDEAWMELLTAVFERRGNNNEMARARARVMYFHQIGYYTLDLREDLESRIRNFPLYHEILTGDRIDPEVDQLIAELKARRAA